MYLTNTDILTKTILQFYAINARKDSLIEAILYLKGGDTSEMAGGYEQCNCVY